MLAVIPSPDLPGRHVDKAVHLWEYLVFAWLLAQAIRSQGLTQGEYLWMAWIFATSYGALMEVIQLLVPWRTADWVDALANAAGAGIGAWLARLWPRRAAPSTD